MEGDDVWYDWFVVDKLGSLIDGLVGSAVSYFDFATGWASAGTYNVTAHARDFSGLFSFFEWFVTVENVNNPNFAVNFADPTPNNGATVHTDYVGIAVEIGGPGAEAPELVTVFDNSTLNFSYGSFDEGTELPAEKDFINISGSNLVGNFTSVIFDAGVDTVWDNISWSEVLLVSGEITPDENTVLLFHLNNDSSYGENDTLVHDFSGNGNNGTGFNFLPHIFRGATFPK